MEIGRLKRSWGNDSRIRINLASTDECTRDEVTRLWSRQWLCLLAVSHSTHQHGIHGCTGDTFSKHTTIIKSATCCTRVARNRPSALPRNVFFTNIKSYHSTPWDFESNSSNLHMSSFNCGVVTLAFTWLSLYACMVDDRQEIKQVGMMWQLNTLAEHMSGIIGLASWAWRHLPSDA